MVFLEASDDVLKYLFLSKKDSIYYHGGGKKLENIYQNS